MSDPVLVHSPFDSDVFRARFLRVVKLDPEAVEQEMPVERSLPLIADVKVPATQPSMVNGFARIGFRKVATMITLVARAIAPTHPEELATDGRSVTPEDIDAHACGFLYSRFRQDPLITDEAVNTLMARWIENSIGGRKSVLAIGRNFCTYSIQGQVLTIDLLSCLDAGQGIASRLLDGIHVAAHAHHCSDIIVTTEAENIPALRTYFRAAFMPVSAAIAMHLVRTEG